MLCAALKMSHDTHSGDIHLQAHIFHFYTQATTSTEFSFRADLYLGCVHNVGSQEQETSMIGSQMYLSSRLEGNIRFGVERNVPTWKRHSLTQRVAPSAHPPRAPSLPIIRALHKSRPTSPLEIACISRPAPGNLREEEGEEGEEGRKQYGADCFSATLIMSVEGHNCRSELVTWHVRPRLLGLSDG